MLFFLGIISSSLEGDQGSARVRTGSTHPLTALDEQVHVFGFDSKAAVSDPIKLFTDRSQESLEGFADGSSVESFQLYANYGPSVQSLQAFANYRPSSMSVEDYEFDPSLESHQEGFTNFGVDEEKKAVR